MEKKAPYVFAIAQVQMNACSVSVANIRCWALRGDWNRWRRLRSPPSVDHVTLGLCACEFMIVGEAGEAMAAKKLFSCFDKAGSSAREHTKQKSWRSCSLVLGGKVACKGSR